jgi:hypothetical protein
MSFEGNAYQKVGDVFAKADTFATTAYKKAESFVNSLNSTLYAPPSISVTWNSIAPPSIEALPSTPVLPVISFDIPGGQPGALTLSDPDIAIDDFDEAAPDLSIPAAPTLSYGVAPTVPVVGNVAVPAAPTIAQVPTPALLSLSTVSFAGVDLKESWLDDLSDIPNLDIVAPTSYTYSRGPEYQSALLDTLKVKLGQRMQGGTGLDPIVEQQIWARSRDRETNIALGNEQEIMRQSEAFGFQLPSGVLAAQLRAAQQDYYDKLSAFSRDVSIKQAEMEQQNLKDSISAGLQLEAQLVDYSWKLEQLAFDTAKQYADNAIQVHAAAVERFNALLQGYKVYADVYKSIIDGQLAKVEVYKAQLSAEETKATINATLVQQYKAQVEASLSQVEIYRAQVSAAETLVQLEQAKIGAAGEQIRAYVAQVNAETAKVEAYKAQVAAEATKVDVYRNKAQAFSAKASAQADRARANISRFTALAQAKTAEWEGYRAKVGAEQARIQALGLQSSSLLDGYRVAATAVTAKAEMQTKIWETQIRQYEAGQNITLQAAKINADNLMTANNARLDASKVGAQVFAQLTASAYGMLNASAGVSGSSGTSTTVSYNYSNDTTSPANTITRA